MQQRPDVTRRLEAWHEDAYAPPAPAYLSEVLERTRHTRQRPAWASLERWLPMKLTSTASAAPRALQPVWILLIVLALVIAVAGIAIIGGRLLAPAPATPARRTRPCSRSRPTRATSRAGDIYTVRADGTGLRQLTNSSSAFGSDQAPVWSPDGTRIAYRGYHGSQNSVEVIDAGGGNRTTLWTSGASREVICAEHDDLAWSPDGRTVAFAAHGVCPGEPDLFVVPADGSAPAGRLLSQGRKGRSRGSRPTASGSPSWALRPAGHRPVRSRGGIDRRRCWRPPGPSGRSRSRRTASWDQYAFPPHWSPDGTELAVVVGPVFGGTGEIVVVKADGSGQRVLATDQAFNPTWSPDGKRIAFHRVVDPSEYWQERPCTMRVWVVNADGSGERRFDPLVDGCVQPPVWSPDGTRLLSLLIVDDYFHVGVLAADGDDPPVVFPQSYGASWQPVAAALPPAPSFAAGSPTP